MLATMLSIIHTNQIRTVRYPLAPPHLAYSLKCMRNLGYALRSLLDLNGSSTLRIRIVCTVVFVFASNHDPISFVSFAGGDGTFLLDTGMSKVSVMELVHNGFLYPHETKAVSPKPSI